jgi:hypothetical protein
MKLYQHVCCTYVVIVSAIPGACTHANSRTSRSRISLTRRAIPKFSRTTSPGSATRTTSNVGYNSQDPNVLRKQIESARNMGIYAFVVDWYGSRRPFLDRSTALLQRIASEQHFHIALMYDETQDDNGHATEDAMEAMELAYQKYIGPSAPGRDAYLLYRGRPVIFVFPKRGHTDWNQVRQQVNQWEAPPILLYEDDPPPQFAKAFDGEYAWVYPGQQGLDSGWPSVGRRLLARFLHEDASQASGRGYGGRSVAGLQRHQSFLELEPPHRCTLRKDVRGHPAPVR